IIKQLIPALKTMQRAFHQLKRHPNFSTRDLQIQGDGYLLKLILEMRFAQIPKLFTKLRELVEKNSGKNSELDKIRPVLDSVSQCFIGANPLKITDISQVDKHLEFLNKISAYFEEITQTTADIKVYYCQNVEMEATGSIVVSGSLAYGCNMTAGGEIKIAGACRRGTYFANEGITVGSAGLNETVKTYLTVAEGGTIRAGTLYPGVEVSVGPGKKTIRKTMRNTEIKFEESRWAVKDWK
ncbi:MAG TPA: DUF342 domain-containing protein, partial [Firmicutes bacterium]|nr:DUF342 domain-containing protein [Bacillota bacterium]